MIVRRPAVAGSFYPASPEALGALVDRLLAAAAGPPRRAVKALIVPHAGYIYSGPIAASAFARLIGQRVARVVLVGPAHRVAVRGMVAPGADRLQTPLGEIVVDTDALATVPAVSANPDAHAREHSLEVELPFIQRVAPGAVIVPIAASHDSPLAIGQVLEQLWGGPETVIVISSDLSHYHPYADGRARDARTVDRILALDTGLEGDDACGCAGINGLSWVARRRGLRPELLDLRSSGDTAGARDSVVGYAALAYSEPQAVAPAEAR